VTAIYLAEVGDVETAVRDHVRESLSGEFGFEVRRLAAEVSMDGAYDPARRQFGSSQILREMLARCPADAVKLLGITGVDLFIPMLSFLFGQAQVGGKCALVSLARLRPEFYNLPPRPALLRERAVKESLHELGHAFGLIHCPEPGCVMSLSTNLAQVDLKREGYCETCGELLREVLRDHRSAAARGR